MTSDTSLFPQKKFKPILVKDACTTSKDVDSSKTESKKNNPNLEEELSTDFKEYVADTAKPEIWKLYKQELSTKSIDLLVVHLGSIKPYEFIGKSKEDALYPNHLGMIGTVRVISGLKPKLAVVSEFGEEFFNCRPKIVNLVRECVSMITKDDDMPCIMPGDVTFEYDIVSRKVFCLQLEYSQHEGWGDLSDYTDDIYIPFGGIICYCSKEFNDYIKEFNDINKLKSAFSKWQIARKSGKGWYLKDIRKDPPNAR